VRVGTALILTQPSNYQKLHSLQQKYNNQNERKELAKFKGIR
jgi:hypothetical protein